jgi:hypothetical protein
VEEANAEVVRRLDEGAPVLTRVGTAADEIPGMGPRTLLHPGPPLPWGAFCDPLRRSARAAILAEGWAADPEGAERVVASGEVQLEAANEHATAIPMASVLGPGAGARGRAAVCAAELTWLNQGRPDPVSASRPEAVQRRSSRGR